MNLLSFNTNIKNNLQPQMKFGKSIFSNKAEWPDTSISESQKKDIEAIQ